MISFETVIRRFGPLALRIQLDESDRTDSQALTSLNDTAAAEAERAGAVRNWLQSYQVFQGIEGPKRLAIATEVVHLFDKRDPQRDLSNVDAVATAHAELMIGCQNANGDKRDFTSLASKALWLCYPEHIPLFDAFAQRALYVISKLEPDTSVPSRNNSEYRQFVYIWVGLYQRYRIAIDAIDIGDYPYRVRIFDKILWLIGEPRYGPREALEE